MNLIQIVLTIFSMVQQILMGQGLLIIEATITLRQTTLGRTNDQPKAKTSTWQPTKVTRDRHLCLRRDSNPQSQQASSRRPTP